MSLLPPGFEALEPHAALWDRGSMIERASQRTRTNADQRKAFFAAASPLFDSAMALLDAKPLAALDEAEQRLLNLMLSLSHVWLAVEIQREDETKHAPHREAMHITCG